MLSLVLPHLLTLTAVRGLKHLHQGHAFPSTFVVILLATRKHLPNATDIGSEASYEQGGQEVGGFTDESHSNEEAVPLLSRHVSSLKF